MIDLTRPTARAGAKYLRQAAHAGLLVYLVLLFYMSLVPVVPGAQEISDKLLHFIAYGILAGLAAAAWPRLNLWVIFIAVSFTGALLEGGQALLNVGRTASWADQFANMGGAGLAIVIWVFLAAAVSKFRSTRAAA